MKALLWREPDGAEHCLVDTLTPERLQERHRMLRAHFPETEPAIVECRDLLRGAWADLAEARRALK